MIDYNKIYEELKKLFYGFQINIITTNDDIKVNINNDYYDFKIFLLRHDYDTTNILLGRIFLEIQDIFLNTYLDKINQNINIYLEKNNNFYSNVHLKIKLKCNKDRFFDIIYYFEKYDIQFKIINGYSIYDMFTEENVIKSISLDLIDLLKNQINFLEYLINRKD